jgi:tetratricopeptide (TPR) repeat protein
MTQKSSKKNFQRLVVIASGLALVGSSVILLIEALLNGDNQQSPTAQTNNNTSPIEQLKAQAQGYEKILEREPNNANALQNLVQIRLQLQDYQGTIAPLEKLIELYPQDAQLPQILTVVKQRVQEQKQPNKQSPTIPTTKPNSSP